MIFKIFLNKSILQYLRFTWILLGLVRDLFMGQLVLFRIMQKLYLWIEFADDCSGTVEIIMKYQLSKIPSSIISSIWFFMNQGLVKTLSCAWSEKKSNIDQQTFIVDEHQDGYNVYNCTKITNVTWYIYVEMDWITQIS